MEIMLSSIGGANIQYTKDTINISLRIKIGDAPLTFTLKGIMNFGLNFSYVIYYKPI